MTSREVTLLGNARAFALAAHGEQRYGDKPYAYHLEAVVRLLWPYGIDAQIVGYLHDVIEDTAASEKEIRALFGDRIADCVLLLTDPPGNTRAERKAVTYARLAEVSGATELALVVKAADRLANLRACVEDGHHRLWTVYQGEHASFRQAAYRPGLCDPLWAEIDALLATS